MAEGHAGKDYLFLSHLCRTPVNLLTSAVQQLVWKYPRVEERHLSPRVETKVSVCDSWTDHLILVEEPPSVASESNSKVKLNVAYFPADHIYLLHRSSLTQLMITPKTFLCDCQFISLFGYAFCPFLESTWFFSRFAMKYTVYFLTQFHYQIVFYSIKAAAFDNFPFLISSMFWT